MVETNGYISQLYNMLQDVDANVVTNAIHVLNELQLSEGGLAATQALVMGLLNRIVEFSEWGLNAVLDLVARYKPASEVTVTKSLYLHTSSPSLTNLSLVAVNRMRCSR